jgi:hypothetical protein
VADARRRSCQPANPDDRHERGRNVEVMRQGCAAPTRTHGIVIRSRRAAPNVGNGRDYGGGEQARSRNQQAMTARPILTAVASEVYRANTR